MPTATKPTILDAMTWIERIENKTPWSTPDLTAFLTPLLMEGPFDRVTISNHSPKPGTKRAEQKIVSLKQDWQDKKHLKIALLSPNRAKVRTDLLDRLSLADDLESHEIALPPEVIERITHSIHRLPRKQSNWSCKRGCCECSIAMESHPIIRGDTKARVRPVVTLARLETKLSYAEGAVENWEAKLSKAIKDRDRLRARVAKRRAAEDR